MPQQTSKKKISDRSIGKNSNVNGSNRSMPKNSSKRSMQKPSDEKIMDLIEGDQPKDFWMNALNPHKSQLEKKDVYDQTAKNQARLPQKSNNNSFSNTSSSHIDKVNQNKPTNDYLNPNDNNP